MEQRCVQDLTEDYITSFNAMMKGGLANIMKYLIPAEFELENKERIRLTIDNVQISKPKCHEDNHRDVYPWECRRRKSTYEGRVQLTLSYTVNGGNVNRLSLPIGTIPIMVRSDLCRLSTLKDGNDYIKHNEEEDELGGYFIVKGNQCMLRYLVQTRRNFPIVRFKVHQSLGAERTGHEVFMRCVREDDTNSEMKMFWRHNGCPELQLQINKKYFQIPLPIVLKALKNGSCYEIFNDIPKSESNVSLIHVLTMMFNRFVSTKPEFMTDVSCLEFLGNRFREYLHVPVWVSNLDAGRLLINEYVAIHVSDYKEKYDVLVLMLLKLHTFVNDACCAESVDTLNFQELLTPGSLFQQVFRMCLVKYLSNVERYIKVQSSKKERKLEDLIRSTISSSILQPIFHLLSTGSIGTMVLPGLKQATGLRILTDNINFYRLAANFRAFHRGAFFITMKSSIIRRLLPESWGFVCPVHTPDGTPCGLLNHLTINTKIQTEYAQNEEENNLKEIVKKYTVSVEQFKSYTNVDEFVCVVLNGKVMGYIRDSNAMQLEKFIRFCKVFPQKKKIPSTTEIVLKNISATAAQYPGIYIFTTPGRMIRPVYNIMWKEAVIEYIAPFEQTYLNISCRGGHISEGGDYDLSVTHQELSPESIYSFTASFTPYQNYNPSPRNLYQCQMSKQSMGFTYYTTRFRSDNKLYCFLNPQIPLVRSKTYDEYDMAKRPLGYNPIVGVCSYTGYDMEDAMVINESSLQRGMGRCCIYKHVVVDLTPDRNRSTESSLGCGEQTIEGLDSDGLPWVGRLLVPGKFSPLYATCCKQTEKVTITHYKESEPGHVISVSLNGSRESATICIKIQRNTDIGDKFSSRHGQKGVNSLKMHMSDMPYSEDGMVPDQLFNPHSFPSRMTMGMEIEFIAGKLAALTASKVDCTAFQQGDILEDYISRLATLHYDGYGTERMKDGYRGRMIDSDLSLGMVYYQRLRHLVADKYQVRTTGKIDSTTRQPVKGRKVGGGIRLGEMERDGLLSHGAVFCLQDRIVDCNSDKVVLNYCTGCQTFMHSYFAPVKDNVSWLANTGTPENSSSWKCKLCENSLSKEAVNRQMLRVQVPAVTRHLFHELITMNLRVKMTVEKIDQSALISN